MEGAPSHDDIMDAVDAEEVVEETVEAPEAEAPEPEPAPEPEAREPEAKEPEAPHSVPLNALLEERERRQAVQRQFEEIQAQQRQREAWEAEQQRLAQEAQQAPDLFEQPEYYQQSIPQLQQQVSQLTAELQQAQRVAYFQNAQAKGDMGLKFAQMQDPETFDKAWQMLEKKTMQDGDGSWRQHLLQTAMQGGDPGAELISLYKNASVQERVGNDPDAFFEKTLEEKLSDEAFMQKLVEKIQGQGAAPAASGRSEVRLPQSINKAGGAGTGPVKGISHQEIMDYIDRD